MSNDSLTHAQWESVLDDADPATYGELVATLEDMDFVPGEPADLVEDATAEDGPLVEDATADSAFAVYRLDDDVEGEEPTDANATDLEEPTAAAESEAGNSRFVNIWGEADFSSPESGVWATGHIEHEQWMAHKSGDKKPFAPWADADAPVECSHHEETTTCAECGHSARYKWGYEGNYTNHEEALEWVNHDPRLAGLAFIQREDDPFAFVDGDDVRDPETGEVHPVFKAFLEHLGVTYGDISVSGAGVHAVYLGNLPEGVKQAVWEIDDEPWGGNDDLPAIEIYDGKHVCVATGEHVPGTPTDAHEWNGDALEAILQANNQLPNRTASAGDFEDFDSTDYDANATKSDETTDEIRDIYAALDRLDAQRVAERTIVDEWLEPSHADYRAFVPTWAEPGYSGTANFVTSDVWKDSGTRGGKGGPACMAAIDAGLVSDRDCPERVTGETWWKAVEHLRSLGFDIPEHVPNTDTDAERDPAELKSLDVTLDPDVAWRAAGAVMPGELEREMSVETTADGSAWLCPHCEGEIGVVRAAAIDAGITPRCSTPLQNSDYDRAYEHARRGVGAPLPEYVSRETATERWDIVRGAIKQLDFWHLDEDEFNSTITGRDDIEGDAELTLDPAWRDSDSGESVIVFPSGVVYDAHPDHSGVIDALRFVALDAGIIDWDDFTSDEHQLQGDTFREVYSAARDYGAPLPRWEGNDAFHTAVLPSPDDIIDDDVGDDDRLHAAYDAMADLYNDAAQTDEASLLRVLPGLGKTEQVFRQATEHPVLYTAGRKELMQDAVSRANENGASAFVLPVFAENAPPVTIQDAAENIVRENGQSMLRNRWSLVDAVEAALPADEELLHPDEYRSLGDEDEVVLDRASCPVANGQYGPDWWLAVHAARARGYRPQQIHQNAAALFGAELPCTCEDGEEDGTATCPYTEAWETATDPDNPIDVLVGHYTHANVEGARTYSTRDNSRVEKDPRVVAIDEFPGGAFQKEFGEEFPDIAAWLAASLRDDVNDRQDLLTNAEDIWNDTAIREWLSRDGTSDEHARVASALSTAKTGLEAVSTAEWLLEQRRDDCSDLGVEDALERLVNAHPEFDAGVVANITATISAAPHSDVHEPNFRNTLNILDELADDLRSIQLSGGSSEADLADSLTNTPHISGTLASLVTDAIEGYHAHDDGAERRLDAAIAALQGGADGCEALAMHADDGSAHPLGHALLYGLLVPDDEDDVSTLRASNFTFGNDDETRLNSVGYRNSRIVLDRNHHGAVINDPPGFTAGGSKTPTVGLDATGRATLWELVLGRDVRTRDIHETDQERREFLREVYGLQMIQTSPHANSYEGDPSGKNFDDDVEMISEIDRQYRDAMGEQPAVLTTKVVEDTLEDRLEPITSATGHYGDLKGSNALANHRLAALLGCQHYGDHVVERWAALAGEEATRTGYGMELDYGSDIANTALQHMREDQVMQAALRFGRDSDGALVFAHTAALRDDLPVVADGEVVRTFSKQAQAIAKAAGELARRPQFTAADVADRVVGYDPSKRTIRRVLSELSEFGYLEKNETPNGYANEFEVNGEPRAAEVELPDIESRAVGDDPGQDPLSVYYTWSVRVSPGDPRPARHRSVGAAQLPAPEGGATDGEGSAPPG